MQRVGDVPAGPQRRRRGAHRDGEVEAPADHDGGPLVEGQPGVGGHPAGVRVPRPERRERGDAVVDGRVAGERGRPVGLTGLAPLRTLKVNNNNLRELPDLWALERLEKLDVSINPISTVADLEQLPALRELGIEATGFQSIPSLPRRWSGDTRSAA